MEILNFANMHLLLTFSFFLAVFCLFFFIANQKQKKAMSKIDMSIKLQEQANQQMSLMVVELRRANRFLSELAGFESVEYSVPPTNAHYSTGQVHNHNAAASNNIPNIPRASHLPLENGEEDVHSANKLYVGNIDYAATEAELAEHFSRFGQVEFVNIPINRYTGRARGFGFVTFVSKEDAEEAMSLNGSEFKGRQIQVNFAKERE